MTETPVNTASLEEFVTQQVIDMGVPASTVKLDAKIDSMGLDSLDVVELTQAVKKQLMIPVKPKDFENAATLQDAVDVIREKAQEKGVEFPSGEIAPAALKIARVNRVVPASAPPTTAASASPNRILRTPAMIACAPEEHAVTIAVVSPCSPWRMEICAGAAFAIIMGTVSGETSSAPSVCITKCCVSRVSSPPIAVPI